MKNTIFFLNLMKQYVLWRQATDIIHYMSCLLLTDKPSGNFDSKAFIFLRNTVDCGVIILRSERCLRSIWRAEGRDFFHTWKDNFLFLYLVCIIRISLKETRLRCDQHCYLLVRYHFLCLLNYFVGTLNLGIF